MQGRSPGGQAGGDVEAAASQPGTDLDGAAPAGKTAGKPVEIAAFGTRYHARQFGQRRQFDVAEI
jgi:hypothetical protein